MPSNEKKPTNYLVEIERLRLRLNEVEESLGAIQRGEVDALVVSGPNGNQIFTLQGAEHPYRLLVEAMKYLAQADPISNRGAIELLSEHVRTRFRMSDSPLS